MRIMTCNIWGDYFHNPVEARMGGFVTLFSDTAPDIVGFQECTDGWYRSGFFDAVSDRYAVYSLTEHNYTPILLKKERFSLIECGFRLYSETPDPSKGYTYLVLHDRPGGKTLGIINTHFWWKSGEEHDRIRCRNARELAACAQNIVRGNDCPVYAFGDFNCLYHSEPFRVLFSEGFTHTADIAAFSDTVSSHHGDPILGSDGLWHGKKTENDRGFSIDHIISMNGTDKIDRYTVATAQYILDSSDHSPVYIDISD